MSRQVAESRPSSAPKDAGRPARRGRRLITFLLLFAACVLIVDALVGDKGVLAIMQVRREHEQLAASIERLRLENARLREQARRLREDPAAIEEIARRELGLIRPGEKLFIIRDVPAPSALPK